jgi:abortive infection bacteriophage resistance protein
LAAPVKEYKTYEQQVTLLESRGMDVGDHESAIAKLGDISYYRLSGYWYPFRVLEQSMRQDRFYPGTSMSDVVKLYDFDTSLRAMTFAALSPVELTVRARLGHELGQISERAHLEPSLLNARAQETGYQDWVAGYEKELNRSREDFVEHHFQKYGGTLPVWAAVEILDWGALTRLFGFAPRLVQDQVADEFGLSAPQFESWMKSLGIVRNVCAHHGRLFNRVFPAPKLPQPGRWPDLDACGPFTRAFGQLSLIQHMLRTRGIGNSNLLRATLTRYPTVQLVPIGHVGVPTGWDSLALWS